MTPNGMLPGPVVKLIFSPGVGGVKWPLINVGSPLLRILTAYNVVVSCTASEVVSGRSWEMACVMGLLGRGGTFSGTVQDLTIIDGMVNVRFGRVHGLAIKRSVDPGLLSYVDIPSVCF